MAKADSIKAKGLESYLNGTAADHNGKNYDDFVWYMVLPKPLTISSLAKIFNVTDPTMRKWVDIYEAESK